MMCLQQSCPPERFPGLFYLLETSRNKAVIFSSKKKITSLFINQGFDLLVGQTKF